MPATTPATSPATSLLPPPQALRFSQRNQRETRVTREWLVRQRHLNKRSDFFSFSSPEPLGYHVAKKRRALGTRMLFVLLNDAQVVSGSEDGRICFWDLVEGKIVHTLEKAQQSVVYSISYHPTEIALLSAFSVVCYTLGSRFKCCLSCLIPHLLVVFTQQLEILVTTLREDQFILQYTYMKSGLKSSCKDQPV